MALMKYLSTPTAVKTQRRRTSATQMAIFAHARHAVLRLGVFRYSAEVNCYFTDSPELNCRTTAR